MSVLIWIQTVDTLIVFLKEFFEKVNFEKNHQTTTKGVRYYPACKELIEPCHKKSVIGIRDLEILKPVCSAGRVYCTLPIANMKALPF